MSGLPPDLVATKLFLPRARAGLVPRARLTERLDAGLTGTLTLVSAPAGFGKSTLLADWLRGQQQAGRGVAWLALDAGDSEPARFVRYLIAALQSWAPGLAAASLDLLAAPLPPPPAAVLPGLINGLLAQPGSGILVLDDYHVIENTAVHAALNFLVDHLPPQLHLVIASREDPPLALARLRARGQLCELRAVDLRFTAAEAAAFLQRVMGLDLAAEQVAAIEARTEGWIAGLQLAALSLRDQADPQGFVAAFTGSNRYVLDYLLEEVLARVPTPTEQFLLHTAIADRLCAPLCAALLADTPGTDATGGAQAQQMLEQIERANLFLSPLDTERRWYRYHPLFADLLRARLAAGDPEAWRRLHGRAAVWHEIHGLLPEAIEHALIAADWARAGRLIGLTFRRMAEAPRELGTVLRWMAALPPEVVRGQPELGVDYAGSLIAAGRIDEAGPLLRAAEQALAAAPGDAGDTPAAAEHQALAGRAAMAATLLAARQGDARRAAVTAQRALALLPPQDRRWRIGTLNYLAEAYLAADDPEAARVAIGEAARLSRAAGDDLYALMMMATLARLLMAQGRLREAAATWGQALRLPGVQALPFLGMAHVGLGEVLTERNDLDRALEHLTLGIAQLTPISGLNTNIIAGYRELARLRRARGDLDGALAAAQQAEEISARTPRPALALPARWLRVQHALSTGDVEAAGLWANSVEYELEKLPPHLRAPGLLLAARVGLAQNRPDAALAILTPLRAAAEAAGRTGHLIEILVLHALALAQRGDRTRAIQTLLDALAPAEPEGYCRLFLDEGAAIRPLLTEAQRQGRAGRYTAALLEQLPAGPAPAPAPRGSRVLVEPLTSRELDVLRLLAVGLSGPEIANTLIMSQNTVKTHLKNLYGKLGAHTRDEALQIARDLKLL
jgi:LuxR family maltose regulon positive regulatory protein